MGNHQGFDYEIDKVGAMWTVSVKHPVTNRLHYGFFTPTNNDEDFLGFLDTLVARARKFEDELIELAIKNEQKKRLRTSS